jgi:hypothetical protein
MEEKILKCETCGDVVNGDLHTCPYKEELDNDYETTCNCCEGCREFCMDEI